MRNGLQAAVGHDVSRETIAKLEVYERLLIEENRLQNLISVRSEAELWQRHIVDSAQLSRFASVAGSWMDIGAGAGLPGIVLAILRPDPITLSEPRRLRAGFLGRLKSALDLPNVSVEQRSAAAIGGKFDFITARAVASVDKIFGMSANLTHDGTIFVLPKGRSAQSELDEARRSWQGDFRLEPSLTSADAAILIASFVKPRGKR